MSELCISVRPDQLLRWQQAFPKGQILRSLSQRRETSVAVETLWLHADGLPDNQLREQILHLQQVFPQLPLVVISCVPSGAAAMTAFQLGGMGYCHALAAPQLFKQVALVVANGGMWIGSELKQQLAGALGRIATPQQAQEQPSVLTLLTNREQQVARQVAAGASNKETAQALEITERTVKAHMGSIFEKLDIRDRLQLALLISPDDL